MPATNYDFSGYATRNDIKCMDGRTIRRDAFKECDGKTVPLVWQHQHDDPAKVLGHAVLENREDGMYAYGYFNDSEGGRTAKSLVGNGDVTSLSIYANQLKEKSGNVFHGVIREVSLVLAGANPGAYIDNLSFEHGDGDDYEDGDAIISFGSAIELMHAEDTATKAEEDSKGEDKMAENSEKTVQDVLDELTEEQKNVVYYLIGEATKNNNDDEDDEEEQDEGDDDVKHNVFENDTMEDTLIHSADMASIFEDARRCGSLKQAVEAYEDEMGGKVTMMHSALRHAVYNDEEFGGGEQTYGIANIGYLFPDYKTIGNTPEFIKRPDEWVRVVMSGVRHTPFSRIKSVFANITMDEARAKGYVKGNRKIEEVFSLLKRTTDPQTIYKKQKLDRDDVIDITDLDVVAFMKGEMRSMLDEEAARAILVGDGRLNTDDDKIFPTHIRPIWGDDPLYSISVPVTPSDNTAKSMIREIIKKRKDYRGSGNLTMFTTEDWLSEMLLLEDGIGHPLYADEAALCRKLRVNKIVTVPVMENQTDGDGNQLAAILVDLKDYNVGADKGGEVNLFDDFDIDFNQMKYLIETRFSGALVRPYSAMVVTIGEADENPSQG